MATITADAVKELRERTGAGMMDCKNALVEADGDLDKAVGLLRERGLAAAAKKAGRDAREGIVSSYIHTGGKLGVADRGQLRDRLRRPDRRVPEARPRPRDAGRRACRRSTSTSSAIPEDGSRGEEGGARRDRTPSRASPPRSSERIVEGQLKKWYQEVCLLEQPFRDEDRAVRDLVTEAISTIGENIRVRRFTRYALGEEL